MKNLPDKGKMVKKNSDIEALKRILEPIINGGNIDVIRILGGEPKNLDNPGTWGLEVAKLLDVLYDNPQIMEDLNTWVKQRIKKLEAKAEEFSIAAISVISGVEKESVREKLRKIESGYNKKTEIVRTRVADIYKDIDEKEASLKKHVDSTRTILKEGVTNPKTKKGLKAKRSKLDKAKVKDANVEDAVENRSIISEKRAEVVARSAKRKVRGYAILATYYALKGDKSKQIKIMQKARVAAQKRMSKLKQTNEVYNNRTLDISIRANKLGELTDNYDLIREQQEKLADKNLELYMSTEVRGKFSRKRNLAKEYNKIDANYVKAEERINRAASAARKVGEVMYATTTGATIAGLDGVAEFVADNAANVTNFVFDVTDQINELSYASLSAINGYRTKYGFKQKIGEAQKEIVKSFSNARKRVSGIIESGIDNVKGFFGDIEITDENVTRRFTPGTRVQLAGFGIIEPRNINQNQPPVSIVKKETIEVDRSL